MTFRLWNRERKRFPSFDGKGGRYASQDEKGVEQYKVRSRDSHLVRSRDSHFVNIYVYVFELIGQGTICVGGVWHSFVYLALTKMPSLPVGVGVFLRRENPEFAILAAILENTRRGGAGQAIVDKEATRGGGGVGGRREKKEGKNAYWITIPR